MKPSVAKYSNFISLFYSKGHSFSIRKINFCLVILVDLCIMQAVSVCMHAVASCKLLHACSKLLHACNKYQHACNKYQHACLHACKNIFMQFRRVTSNALQIVQGDCCMLKTLHMSYLILITSLIKRYVVIKVYVNFTPITSRNM